MRDLLELLLLGKILKDYNIDSEYQEFLDENYDVEKISTRYIELGKSFLKEYALDNTEKSEENL